MIGLSGLITPSLDERVYFASEMQRRGLTIPLLIGGATTSPAHTAIKIEPQMQSAPVVHVLDASRAVGVVSQLMGDAREKFWGETKAKYQKIRDTRAGGPAKARVPIAKARDMAHKAARACGRSTMSIWRRWRGISTGRRISRAGISRGAIP
jgi:5-methyltetrahydrofolate--homocysteine methyltransferase